jgi:transcriptional regulator of acetoin/glycerol metabolism
MQSDLENARQAWSDYVATGRVPAELLRPVIVRAWTRCQSLGVNPQSREPRVLSPADTRALLLRQASLIEAARPYMRALRQAAGSDHHVTVLADRHGVVLVAEGDEEALRDPSSFARPGSWTSEEVAGANGIGTALAEDEYVEIAGAEHFLAAFHLFTCQAVPLHEPPGVVVGALCVCLHRVQAIERLRDYLVCAAHAIEAELSRETLAFDRESLLRATVGRVPGGKTEVFERLRQDVLQHHAAARLRLEGAARALRADRVEEAARLVAIAEGHNRKFRHQAELWWDLMSERSAPRHPVELTEYASQVVELLRTEAAIRKIRIQVRAQAPLHVLGDPRALGRSLVGLILHVFDRVDAGSEIELVVGAASEGARAMISVCARGQTLVALPFAARVKAVST